MDAMDAIMERKEERPFIATDDELEEDLRMCKYRESGLTTVVLRQSMLWARCSLRKVPMKMNVTSIGALVVFLAVLLPKPLTYMLLYPLFRLVFGTLYPAYASYKAVRTQNVKEYVKWMMYWIVFALFTCAETFTDVFFSFWFPFYYEIKIILVLWLLSPATKGSSILYRRFVHPALTRREAEIDEALARATEQGYKAVLHLGTRGVNYATTVLMQTAIKNLTSVLPIAANALPSSESDTAISSLASRPQTPAGQQPQTQQRSNEAPSSARDDQSKKEDSSDGVATTTVSNRKRRSKSKNVSVDYPLDLELRQVSTDEDTAVADAPLYDLPVELLVKKMMEEGRVFKAPPEKTRKSRKERNTESTRKQKSRSCKESAKNYAADFSEDADLS